MWMSTCNIRLLLKCLELKNIYWTQIIMTPRYGAAKNSAKAQKAPMFSENN